MRLTWLLSLLLVATSGCCKEVPKPKLGHLTFESVEITSPRIIQELRSNPSKVRVTVVLFKNDERYAILFDSKVHKKVTAINGDSSKPISYGYLAGGDQPIVPVEGHPSDRLQAKVYYFDPDGMENLVLWNEEKDKVINLKTSNNHCSLSLRTVVFAGNRSPE